MVDKTPAAAPGGRKVQVEIIDSGASTPDGEQAGSLAGGGVDAGTSAPSSRTPDAATVRLRYTLVIEYDARPADYEGADGDPEKMAAMDLESVARGDLAAYDLLGDLKAEKVEVVQ